MAMNNTINTTSFLQMKFNKLSVLIGVALLPSWNVLADTIEQTLTFIPYHCNPGWFCKYKASLSDQVGLDTSQLDRYEMTFKSEPQVPGVNVSESIWSDGSFVVTSGHSKQFVQEWPKFSATVTCSGQVKLATVL